MKKLLIVEDDQLVGNIYRNKFLVEGFKVELAHDGETALQTIGVFQPDAVLLDLVLPKMSGVEVMKEIRKDPQFKNLPLVVFSNTFLTNLVREAWQAGATKCLSKAHCTPNQLISAVKNALSTAVGSQPIPSTPGTGTSSATAPARNLPRPHQSNIPRDPQTQEELKITFLDGLPSTLNAMRGLLQRLMKSSSETERLGYLNDLARQVHSIGLSAAVSEFTQMAQFAEAVEALLKDLHQKPKNLTASPLRTLASALDVMGTLFEEAQRGEIAASGSPRILVVDDEPISRRAITHALEQAKLAALSLEDPAAAYNLLASNPFDLVFLDVDMPGMTGFELCSKIRTLPAHKETPVVFVTSLDDFESRTSSTVSGGNDFIAKPFMFIELAVKAFIFILRQRSKATTL